VGRLLDTNRRTEIGWCDEVYDGAVIAAMLRE
jgi:hypothetical protein